MFQGIECQQAVDVSGTGKIRNFAGTLTRFMQEQLQDLKKQNHRAYLPTTPGSFDQQNSGQQQGKSGCHHPAGSGSFSDSFTFAHKR